jgi:hypothetical protein
MNLPHCEKAYVPRQKLTEYMLSETHPVGRSKAQFLRAAGFNERNVDLLERALLAIARGEEVIETVPSSYGEKFVVDGMLATPDGSLLRVRTIWILEHGDNRPRFVTAYPQ